ncbi:MAG: DUF1501 domain-containing protein [Planctomycetota bacterium]|jgi:hypothetical protein
MDPITEYSREMTRRSLFGKGALGVGAAALYTMLGANTSTARAAKGYEGGSSAVGGLPYLPHYAPRAKRVIYLFMSGGPSQIDLFDYKPVLDKLDMTELPDSVRGGQRVTGMTARQASFPVIRPRFEFKRHGAHGTWVSELLPHTAKIVDDISIIKTLNTDAINHDPGVTYFQTGAQIPGKPSLGAWLSYGLGSVNRNLPAYMVLLSQGTGKKPGQPLFDRLWSSGFLPSSHQGVKLRSGKDPVLYLSNPPGVSRDNRRGALDALAKLNAIEAKRSGDAEVDARIAQYEMAFRMQTSVPGLMDISDEPEATFDLYGPESRTPGTFSANCLLARRMAERGVRFIQLFHRGWDQHKILPQDLSAQCRDTDQACAGLITDLKRRGLLEDTLVVWSGEFGRTVYGQGYKNDKVYGRDHHGRCFTGWMAGGGVKPGFEYGQTDDYCYNIAEDPVNVRDLHATMLNQMGINHERFTFKYQGLSQRLTGVEETRVIEEVLA